MDPEADRLARDAEREALIAELASDLDLTAEECARLERGVRWMEQVHVARRPPPLRPRSTSRARESHRDRAGHRRGSRSTRAGPSDDPDEPEPALRLAAPPKSIYTFACLTPEQRGEA